MLKSCTYCSADISCDTFSGRYATSTSALARESLEKQLTNEPWHPPIEKEDNGLQPHRQKHFITGSSSKPWEPEEHEVQKISQKHRLKHDDPCGLLKWSSPRYFQTNNSLICKYVPYDQFQDYMKEKKPNHREHSKPEKEQIQIYSAIEKFLMSKDNLELSGLSRNIKKTYSPEVSFHDPDLVENNRLAVSSKTSTHWKHQKNQSNHMTNLNLKKRSNPWERNTGGKWLTEPQNLKKKRTNQSDLKGKMKKQNQRIKLNLHPFRKVRVHPEKSLPELPKKCKQVLLPLNKLSKASEKEAKINLLSSADLPQQPESYNYVTLIPKRLPLKHAPMETPNYKEHAEKAPLLNTTNLHVVNKSSKEDNCQPTGHVPDENPALMPGLIPIIAKHRHVHSQFSNEQMEGATHLPLEVSGYLPVSWGNTGSDVLASCHSRGSTDQQTTEPIENMEQDKLKTNELNQFSLSLENQTQLVGVHKMDISQEHTLDQNQMLQQVEQHSSNELGNEEKSLMTKPQISHQIMESCIMDEGNDVEKKLPKAETYDSSLILKTQLKDNRTFMKTNSNPYQNRTELPNISTSFSTQAIWCLTNSSEKGTDSTNVLPRDDGTEVLEIKIAEKEEKKMADESKANSSMLVPTRQMILKGATKEKQQFWENGKSKNLILNDSSSVEVTITAEDLNITRSHETENRLPPSEIDLQMNINMCDLREAPNIQPEKDNSAHEEVTMTVGTHKAPFLLPQLKAISSEAENEVSLIPIRKNEAEISAPESTLYPPSADYTNISPLEVEYSEQNNSNNNHFLP